MSGLEQTCNRPRDERQGLLGIPSPSRGGLGWGRLFVARKVADASDFTLTPTLSLKGEGQSKGPGMNGRLLQFHHCAVVLDADADDGRNLLVEYGKDGVVHVADAVYPAGHDVVEYGLFAEGLEFR